MYNTPEKRREYDRKWAKDNSKLRQAINARWQQKRLEWFKEFKSKLKCNRCNETHIQCLQFHHTNPAEKEGNVGNLAKTWSEERLLKEIAKCEILCGNCHVKEHTKFDCFR